MSEWNQETKPARVFIDERRVLRAIVISDRAGRWRIELVTQNRTSVVATSSSAVVARAWLVNKFGPGKFIYSGSIAADEADEDHCGRCGRPNAEESK